MNEFELIARYFTRASRERRGVGDDCALIDVGGRTLAITCDMLVEARHFHPDVDAAALGHKALAVNLSDLAAAGAQPRCFFLALALPRADERWLAAFSSGLLRLADAHGCELIGGDTTRAPQWRGAEGPLTICITAIGDVEASALSRAGANPGDDLWVSGTLGDAACALELIAGRADAGADDRAFLLDRLQRPVPRVRLGRELRGVATAAMDISDGLLGDLTHIGERSGVGARIRWTDVPRSAALRRQDPVLQQRCALAGGDDYELLFTAAPALRERVLAAAANADVAVTRIGEIVAGDEIVIVDGVGRKIDTPWTAYDHFARQSPGLSLE